MSAADAADAETTAPNNEANPDPELFYELVSTVTNLTHRVSKPDALSNYIYYIGKHQTLSYKDFDLKVHRGDSKKGDVLGVLKMHHRGFTVGVGNPDTVIEEGGGGAKMIWEELERPQKWSHKVYFFKYGSGEQRKTYTYRKTYRGLGGLKSMELRVGGVEDEDGELVGKWVSGSKWFMKRGNLFIKKLKPHGKGQEAPTSEELRNWELMVMLTAFGIIESQIRRK